MRFSMRARLLAAAVVVLALAGCSAEAPAPAATTTAPPAIAGPEVILNPELVPHPLSIATEETAAVEAARLLDALEALVAGGGILTTEPDAQFMPSADDLPPYYVAERRYSLNPETDPLELAQSIVAIMRKSGWVTYEEVNEGGQYVAAMSSSSYETPWYAIVGGDTTVAGESWVTVQLASPDLVG